MTVQKQEECGSGLVLTLCIEVVALGPFVKGLRSVVSGGGAVAAVTKQLIRTVSGWGILQLPIALPADSHLCTLICDQAHGAAVEMGRTQTLSACGCVQQSRVPVETFSKHIEKVGVQSEPWICSQQ